MNRAIFLDRDGVIIENVDTYVRSWEDVAVLPGAFEALARLRNSRYKIVLVTNQSVVGRGIIPLREALEINDRLIRLARDAGGRVDSVFICPHAPEENCDCRKPKPGLFLQAAAQLSLDLENSVMIGDALTDIEAGQNAGIRTNILLKTGRGAIQADLPAARRLTPFYTYENLTDAVNNLLAGLLSNTSSLPGASLTT
jgi:D-glycero-D-manno-heptose 1,7-bisphosphate phosphatase